MKRFTHIDTGGHGYLSVPKKLIKSLDLVHEISGFSGLSANRVYLEEDYDSDVFLKALDAKGIKYKVKSTYNPRFNRRHCYRVDLFDLKVGQVIERADGERCVVHSIMGNQVQVGAYKPVDYSKLCKIW